MPHISATTVVVLMDSVEEKKKEGIKIDPLQQGKKWHIPLSWCVISLGKTSLLRLCECAGVTSLQIPSRLSEQEYGSRSEDWHQVVNTSTLLQTFLVCHSCPSMLHIYFNRGNIHSVLCKQEKWTHSYWDEFVSLPAIVPHGPIAILGLGGGTAAHLMLETWPSLRIEGWEIDEILIDMAREHLGLSDLERLTEAGGSLSVHIGDAFSPSVSVEGGFAGIIVDLFSDGKILPQLYEDATWLAIEKKLMPNGRIMVNCGGPEVKSLGCGNPTVNAEVPPRGSWLQSSTIKVLCRVFPERLSWKRMAEDESDNFLALTGPPPDLEAWSASLASPLSSNVKNWRPC